MKIEKIKRYEIDGLKAYIDCKDLKFKLADFEEPYGDLCFYNDHKQILDSMHNLLTDLYESILELMDNEMSGMDYRALRDEAQKYLQDTKEKS